MRKILSGIAFALIVLVGVGSYSLTLRAQQRAEQELTGAFAMLRAALGNGSVGRIEVDLGQRAFKVSDIELQTNRQAIPGLNAPGMTIKIRELSATGIDFPADWRLSAGRIEALDVEISGTIELQPAMTITYKAPQITITDFNGPIALLRPVDSSSLMDVSRLVLEHLIATAATSVSIPILTTTVSPATAGPQPIGPVTYTYTDFGLRGMRGGRVADMSVERAQFTLTSPPEIFGNITGEVGRATLSDFDANVLLAVLDPAKATDDRLLRLQGRSKVGPYSIRLDNGVTVEIAGIEVDQIAVRPAKLRFAELIALTESLTPRVGLPPATPPDPSQITNLVADIYEGVSMGLFEIRGVAVNVPQMPPFKLGAFRLRGLENGKLAEFALEGAEGLTPNQQPVKVGRFALKGIDFANIVRVAGRIGGGQPTPYAMASLIPSLEGAELSDVTAPYKDTKSMVHIDTFAVSWGRFVGPIPTAARLTARMSGPLDVGDPDLIKLLASAGFTSANVNFDLGAAWNEATHDFALDPASFEIGNLLSLAARVALANVPREIFSVDPAQVTLAAGQVEAGLVEIVLRDAGALDLAIAELAQQQGQSMPAARTFVVENLNAAATPFIALNPELRPAIAAIARFIETPRSALTIRLIPKGRVALQTAIEAAAADPTAVLSNFRIDVTTGR